MLGLSNGYFLYFFTLPIDGACCCGNGAARRYPAPAELPTPRVRSAFGLAIVAITGAVVFAPIAAAYLRAQSSLGLHRNLGELREFSATAADYLKIPPALWLWTGRLASGTAERSLFPGAFTVGARRHRRSSGCVDRRLHPPPPTTQSGRRFLVIVYVVVCAIAAWLTLGPFAPGPYRALD